MEFTGTNRESVQAFIQLCQPFFLQERRLQGGPPSFILLPSSLQAGDRTTLSTRPKDFRRGLLTADDDTVGMFWVYGVLTGAFLDFLRLMLGRIRSGLARRRDVKNQLSNYISNAVAITRVVPAVDFAHIPDATRAALAQDPKPSLFVSYCILHAWNPELRWMQEVGAVTEADVRTAAEYLCRLDGTLAVSIQRDIHKGNGIYYEKPRRCWHARRLWASLCCRAVAIAATPAPAPAPAAAAAAQGPDDEAGVEAHAEDYV
jgi:hypothetical protein